MQKYLYELSDWPEFRWDHHRLQPAVSEVRFQQGLLIGRLEALGFGDRRDAAFESLIDEVRKTSDIEGEHLDEKQVRSSIAKRLGIEVAGLPEADRHVDGVVEMVLDATENYKKPLTEERLFRWHSGLFPYPRGPFGEIRVGTWRDDAGGPMQVVSGPMGREKVHYQAPDADRLDAEMVRFLQWFDHGPPIDPILKAGVAHLWFETLHPFDDGNGRIGRAVMDMALARSEDRAWRAYSISAQIRKERNAYYAALERAQGPSMDVTPWLEWFLACLGQALSTALAQLEVSAKQRRFWGSIGQITISERQRKVLRTVLERAEPRLTNKSYAKIGKCSSDTALRDLTELVEKGILIREAAGGRSTSYAFVSGPPTLLLGEGVGG